MRVCKRACSRVLRLVDKVISKAGEVSSTGYVSVNTSVTMNCLYQIDWITAGPRISCPLLSNETIFYNESGCLSVYPSISIYLSVIS